MKILDKYITREFLRTYLIIFLSFVAIFIVIDVIDNLPRLIRNGATAQQATIYYLMRLPYLLVLTSPVKVLLTGFFLMGALSKHNESIAIRAAGISIKRAMLPLFGIGLIISIGIALFGEYVVPWAETTKNYVYNVQIKGQQADDQMLKARIHYQGKANDFYYFGFFDGYKNNLKIIDLTRIDFKTKQITEHITAASADWNGSRWILRDCDMRRFANGKQVFMVHYPQTDLVILDVQPQDFIRISQKTLSLNFWQLREYIGRMKKLGDNPAREIVDLNMKISFPLTNLIVIFFFIPIATSNIRSKGRGWIIMLGLVVCFTYLIVVRVCQSLGYNSIINPFWAAWFPNLFFTILGLGFLYKAEI